MKRNEIQIGGRYVARVSGKLVAVEILRERATDRLYKGCGDWRKKHGGWDARNTLTGRAIHIRSAARLRRPAPQAPQAPTTLQDALGAARAHAPIPQPITEADLTREGL